MLHNKIRIIKAAGAAVLALAMTTALSGCGSYWNGYSEAESRQLIEDALQEKYGEEFVVEKIGTRPGSSWDAPSSLTATCYSKNNNTFAFEARYYEYNNSSKIQDMYIQEKISKEIKSVINSVLSKYYDKYAVEVAISGLADDYDPELTVVETVTIESFSIAMTQDGKSMYCDSWIILDNSNREIYNEQELENIIQEITEQLYYMNVFFEFCYVDDALLCESIEVTRNEINNSRDIEKIIDLEHKEFGYHYDCIEKKITKYKPRVG